LSASRGRERERPTAGPCHSKMTFEGAPTPPVGDTCRNAGSCSAPSPTPQSAPRRCCPRIAAATPPMKPPLTAAFDPFSCAIDTITAEIRPRPRRPLAPIKQVSYYIQAHRRGGGYQLRALHRPTSSRIKTYRNWSATTHHPPTPPPTHLNTQQYLVAHNAPRHATHTSSYGPNR
jgi:hypothetical protein